MKLLRYVLLFLFLLKFSDIFSQIENYKEDFALPLKISPNLAGNFGEPRARHFHAGIDFKTYTENKEIVSVADGYISRVSVSPWGYGLAIYITHYNGFTSVYGHLNKFKPDLEAFVRKIQYEKSTFSIDTIIPEGLFPVKKNDFIGYSGNTGHSEGPHLHFEIRETESEFSLNTVTSVYDIKDNICPEVYSVVIYPISENAFVDGKNQKKLYSLALKQACKYGLANNYVPKLKGDIGIGVAYIDKMNDTHNKFGAKSVKLHVNDSLFYFSLMDKVDFEKQRCKNSVFDFTYHLTKSQHVHKTFVEPNNDLDMFTELINNGIFNIKPGEIKKIKVEIIDFNDNISFVEFNVEGDKKEYPIDQVKKMKWDRYNLLLFESGRVEIDSASMFFDNEIIIRKTGSKKISNSYRIGNDDIALKKDIKLSFYLNDEACKYKDKIIVSRIHNKRKSCIKGKVDQNYITVASNSFGEFSLEIDTIPPVITPKNIYKGCNLTNAGYIEISIADNLSGISKYDMYINDIWVLGQYEPKNRSVRYYFDEHFPKSDSYIFKAVVSDVVGNKSEYTCNFYK